MTLPATIQPRVGQSLITRVTRLYNGTLFDCLAELLQNCGATIWIRKPDNQDQNP